jgi:hypothetical protein
MARIRRTGIVRPAVVIALWSVGGCYTGLSLDGTVVDNDGASDGTSEGETGDEELESQCLDDGPSVGVGRMRLLTRYEYDNTVRDLLGDETQPASRFPPENRSTAFENNASDHRAGKDLVRAYLDAAEDVARRVVDERIDSLLPCDPAVDGEMTCGHALIEHLLGRAFRRPAAPEELASFERFFDDVYAQEGFSDAVAMVVETALQSPQFLYRLESVPEDAQPGDVVEVTGYAMASRLSYFLTASMPDEELFAAAAEGRLSTAEEIESQARRLLAGDRGRRAVAEFHRQWLGLGGLSSVVKSPDLYPDLAGLDAFQLGAQWQQSLETFTEHVFFDKGTIDALFESNLAFLPPDLAAVYGLGSPDSDSGAYTLEGERAGLLTQPGLMALLSLPDQSSPIARGVFVRERLLCQHLPPPPPDAVIGELELDPDATTRERVAELTADPACAGCHVLINPVGFGFEHYDAIGRWRDDENGRAIDASGHLSSVNDRSIEGDFEGAVELADKIAASTDFQDCVVQQWTGRHLDFGGRTNNDLHVSLQNAFGIESQTFGDTQFCTGPLAGLTV